MANALPGELRKSDSSMERREVPRCAGDRGIGRDQGTPVRGAAARAFAALALHPGGGQFYGVIAFFVARAPPEIAVRVALGDAPRGVQAGARRRYRLLVVGLVAGAIAAQFLTRLIASLLFGATATDVPTYLLVFAMLSTVALVASYLPARRAARVDPIAALP